MGADLRVELVPLDAAGFGQLEASWRALERRAQDITPYLSYDWLSCWVETYRPARLAVIRILDEGGDTRALGLVEAIGRGDVWRFAGWPITPDRRLLCAGGAEAVAWNALSRWLATGPVGVAGLDGDGGGHMVLSLPDVLTEDIPWFACDLPASFDAYMADRPGATRRRLRQRLRQLEREHGYVDSAEDLREALGEMVRLHVARAEAHGKRRKQMDDRLVTMLASLAGRETVRLLVTRVVASDEVAGVAVHLDFQRTRHFYNAGVREAPFGAGVVLELDAIRGAIDRDLAQFDFGAGDYRYKRELGGVAEARYEFLSVPPTRRGTWIRLRHSARGRLRRLARR